MHKKKQYRKDTLFIAYALLDRFLSRGKLEILPNGVLDLVQLGAVCLLLAAKLNQPLSPSFYQMILLMDDQYRADPLCKKKMIDLEFNVVSQLEFDLQIQTPLIFLGRHLMYFLKNVRSSSEKKVIEHTALQFLKFMAYKATYLEFKPSH